MKSTAESSFPTCEVLLSPDEVAFWLGVEVNTLAKWRMRSSKVNLTFIKVTHQLVRYRKLDVDRFISECATTPGTPCLNVLDKTQVRTSAESPD